ncbi:Sir2 family protein [Colletotrichum abscissum]|uniref:Sir2 family protein n=1 Tax=Colletotrichum abscissum TaxID=1671311 RepID=UPI0027D5CF99|nr:Sir2 family protein [Colletotrichum abscissum]KAK1505879.1 Sir2 family protein [Colletotrichum abscissum]
MAPHNDIAAFHEALASSKRILALCGAGLSASSGLPTFRGAGGLWRNHDATDLATMKAFRRDPGLVWLFYAYRRHMALSAKPNKAHYALAALAEKNPDFLCLTQNVDGLSPRAGHKEDQLRLLHGSLFDIKCANPQCTYIDHNNTQDPLCPALAPASEDLADPTKTLPLLDPTKKLPTIDEADLPHCPSCKTGLLRPGVVWFGEALDEAMLDGVDAWIGQGKVDLMIVVGTSAQVWPAAGYILKAHAAGARVCTVNPEAEDEGQMGKVKKGDFAFGRDAAEVLPLLLEPVIGKMRADGRAYTEDWKAE